MDSTSSTDAPRVRRPWWKKLLLALGVLVVLIGALGGATVAWAYSNVGERMERSWEVSVPPLDIRTDEASLARGEHLVRHVCACVECHGDDLGGKRMVDDPALGLVEAPNLTRGRGGRGLGLDVEDWERAILHGVGTHGRSLLIMPAEDYTRLSAQDLAALIAYARSVPPVDRETRIELEPLAYVLGATDELPIASAEHVDHQARLPEHVEPGPTRVYGEYLGRVCIGCHGDDFGGQESGPPETPPAPSLRGLATRGWDQASFDAALRRGEGRGRRLHEFMPWRAYAGLHDDEASALWSFFSTVE